MRCALLTGLLGFAALTPLARAEVFQIGALRVSNAWIPAMTRPGDGAGYLTIDNGGPADALIGASCARTFGTTLSDEHMHNVVANGMVPMSTDMSPILAEIPVPASGQVVLKPGGNRLLLEQLLKPLLAGDKIGCILRFRQAGPLDVVLEVIATPSAPPSIPARATQQAKAPGP